MGLPRWRRIPVAQMVKNLPAVQETQVRSLRQEDHLEKGMAVHASVLAWRIPWTEEPGGVQPVGSQRVGRDWATNTTTQLLQKNLPAAWEAQLDPWVGKIPRRRVWLLTAVSCLICALCLTHVCFSGTWAHTRNLIYVCAEQQMSPMLFTLFI